MKDLIDFYKHLITTFLEKELLLNNLHDFFTFHEIVESGYCAKRFINNEELYKSFIAVYENNKIEYIRLSPKSGCIDLSLYELKEYLNINFSVFNNFREMSTKFIFKLNEQREIEFIVYKDIRQKKSILNIYNNGTISENEIYCEELILRYK